MDNTTDNTEVWNDICDDEATRGVLLQMFVNRDHPELILDFAEFVDEFDEYMLSSSAEVGILTVKD